MAILLTLGGGAVAQQSGAAGSGELLSPRNESAPVGGRVKRAQKSSVNAAGLQRILLNINLFPDRKIVAVRDRLQRSANGDSVWIGRVLGEPFSRVTLANRAGAVAGSIELARYGGSELYEITPAAAGDSIVSEVQMTGEVCPDILPEVQLPPGGDPPVAGDGSVSTVDLLVVYTPASRALYGEAGLQAMILAAVADANTSYLNSQINAELNLKAMVEVNYTETGDMGTALTRLQNPGDGIIDEVHALRETYAADVVSLVDEDFSSAGIGYVMGSPSTNFAPYAFNVVYSGALSGLTLVHEVGHNMGCQHNRENAGFQGSFPYAYGMRRCTVDGTGFRTVMSYYCTDAPRIPYFSNPNLEFNGVPLGIAYEADPANSCDNARCINATVATVAMFRGAGSPVPPAPTNLSGTAISASQIDLTWSDNATNETGYRVYRSLDQSVWTQLISLPNNSTSFIDITAAASTSYFFKVIAYNSSGSSADSNIAFVTTPALPAPATPASLAAGAVSSSQINLTWQDLSTNEDGFVIERSLDGFAFSALTTVAANATAFADTGLTGSTTYHYRIYAFNAGGPSNQTDPVSATTLAAGPPPNAPSSLVLTVKGTQSIALAWRDNSSNETGFLIERSPDGLSFTEIGTVGVDIKAFTDTGLTPSTRYYYRVAAYNGAASSAYTPVVAATTAALPPPPLAPTSLVLTVMSYSSIKLAWTDKSSNELGFKVERSLDGADFVQIGAVGAGVRIFTDTGLAPSTLHFYRVAAYNDGGTSGYTNLASATTAPLPPPPAAPTALVLTVMSYSSIKLAWTDKSSNELGFKIERSLDGVDFIQIGTMGAGIRAFTDTGLTPSTLFYYRVFAYNDGGTSASTNLASATTAPPPPPPVAPTTLVLTVKSSSQISLAWSDKSSNELGFKIERSLDGVDFTQIATVGTGIKTYLNTGLASQTRYYFRVRAYNAGGDSAYTNIASATTP